MRLAVGVLAALLVAAALSLITAQHRSRGLFVDLERAQQQARLLEAEGDRPRIELGRAAQSASVEALQQVPDVGEIVAKHVYYFFRQPHNLEVLARTDSSAGEWGRAATNDLVRSKIKIKSLNFMRGRTFLNKFVIIDEAQNLTPKQMKTLITRAGPGTKIICMGNLAQIDTPYLTEGSSGLTYAVDRFKGWAHGGHITLARGERSRLADFASEVL